LRDHPGEYELDEGSHQAHSVIETCEKQLDDKGYDEKSRNHINQFIS
jgi:hypothetical protein